MRFKLQIDGAEHQVEAGPDGTVVLDGESFQVKVNGGTDERRVVQVGGRTFEVRIVEACADGGRALLEVAGERVRVSVDAVEKETAGTMKAGENGPEESVGVPEEVTEGIWAPVPGKIVEVFVKTGDRVAEGDPVLILEAMKMENELHAPSKGTIARLLVKKGDQVEKGQLLVALR